MSRFNGQKVLLLTLKYRIINGIIFSLLWTNNIILHNISFDLTGCSFLVCFHLWSNTFISLFLKSQNFLTPAWRYSLLLKVTAVVVVVVVKVHSSLTK